MIRKIDKENKFISMFNPETGFYMRSGVIENGEDTGKDPFMTLFPELLDIGIMQKCVCAQKCNVDCYQKAIDRHGNNMSLANYTKILEECKGKVFQVALGGAGDVDTHENFEEILFKTREYGIVPNFTTSGITMTKDKADICKKYCGAIAVSEHFSDYTNKALDLLLDAGVKTNIHYVLSNKTIDIAIERLQNDGFKKGINAVVFLLYKPVGLGKEENVLRYSDERIKQFFDLIDNNKCSHKIGFDSCSCSGIINFTNNINRDSLDFCEGGRYSAYIDANMNMMPCSFANQNLKWFVSLYENTIQQAWDSDIFNSFRYSLRNSCNKCKDQQNCGGGCPLVNSITLCNRQERQFEQKGKLHENKK